MASKLTQTKLADEFGLSSIAMGKKLIELKLRDPVTKLVTEYAYNLGLGHNISYVKDGKEINVALWNHNVINYIRKKSQNDYDFKAQSLIGKLKAMKKIEDEDSGGKIEQMEFDYKRELFVEDWNKFNKDENVLNTFLKLLKKENLLTFAQQFDEMEEIFKIEKS